MTIDVHTKKEIEEFIDKDLSKGEERIIKDASINWDGANFLIRIPKDIARASGLTEDNVLRRKLLFLIEVDAEGNVSKTFDIIERKEPKRKVNKNAKKK